MPRLPRPRIERPTLLVLAGLVAVGVAVLFTKWREAGARGGQREAEPFRIAGNFYYVGANDVTAFLVTSPQGHILIDGGYPGTPPLIMASIAKLGFDIKDVRVLLNSEPHYDHAGGLAALQNASGAKLYASAPSAEVIDAGGGDEAAMLPLMKPFVWTGLITYAPAHVDGTFKDGDTIRVGTTALVAHITPGHTRGCTTWSLQVHEGERVLDVVSACSLSMLPGMRFTEPQRYPGIRTDFERTFRTLRSLPVDIWVTAHARDFGRYRKFKARGTTGDSVTPFIDPEGYRAYIDSGEARFQRLFAEQRRGG